MASKVQVPLLVEAGGTAIAGGKAARLVAGDGVTLTPSLDINLRPVLTLAASGGGGGGTPATTVVAETSYGQEAAVGIATNYAREDHTHGSVDLPTPTDIGAVPTSRTISAGTGLTGGGDLTTNRTLTVAYGTGVGTACVGNDSRLSDARAPTGNAGGQLGSTYPNPDVRGLRETSGPTNLTMGAVAEGQVLKRVGNTIVGAYVALAYVTSPMAEVDAGGALMGTYTTAAGSVA